MHPPRHGSEHQGCRTGEIDKVKPRIRDIALKANVSPATVSNALNGREGVSKALSEEIHRLAKEMGYVPARTRGNDDRRHVRLIVYKSHGMVVMDTQFFAELIENVQLECQRAGLELIISHVNASDGKELQMRIRDFCAEECAGILLLGTEMNAEELQPFKKCRSPLLVLDNIFRHEPVSSVVMNNYEAGYQATHALYAAGHRDIEHITSSIMFSNVRYRRKGYEAAMNELGLPTTKDAIWPVRPSIEGAYEDMKELLKTRKKLPSAFFAANDLMAIGCMRALEENGYKIPEDVSIIGMDDTPICLACSPALSTMRVFRKEIAIAAVRTLLSLVPDMDRCRIKTEISVALVERGTVRKI